MEIFRIIFLCFLGAMSIITFLLYAIDKVKSRKGQFRIPEVVLLLCSILGGALGGYLAMIIKHHKTTKWYFMLTNILGLALHVLLVYLMFR